MGDKTSISWTQSDDGRAGATWNALRGCSRTIAKGAKHSGCGDPTGGGCYAERNGYRFSGPGLPYEGLVRMTPRGARWTGKVVLVDEHLLDPIRWKRPRRIFTTSVSDPFHEKLSNEAIAILMGVIAATPRHVQQCLTKRISRARGWFKWVEIEARAADLTPAAYCFSMLKRYVDTDPRGAFSDHDRKSLGVLGANSGAANSAPWPLPNLWLGTSVENQPAAEERVPELLATPAVIRFLSIEPLIGEVDLDLARCDDPNHGPDEWSVDESATPWCNECDAERSYGHWLHLDGGVDWIICGCESGPGARPCDVRWVRAIRDQCADAGVAYFLKQGTYNHEPFAQIGSVRMTVLDAGIGSKRKSGHVIELPYLDGEQHANFPTTP